MLFDCSTKRNKDSSGLQLAPGCHNIKPRQEQHVSQFAKKPVAKQNCQLVLVNAIFCVIEGLRSVSYDVCMLCSLRLMTDGQLCSVIYKTIITDFYLELHIQLHVIYYWQLSQISSVNNKKIYSLLILSVQTHMCLCRNSHGSFTNV